MKKIFELPLINTHTHAAMVAFRGIAEDLPLDRWLQEHIWPAEKEQVTPSFVFENTLVAIKEMKKNGIRAFNDMYFFEEEVAKAAIQEQIAVVIGECILDFPTPSAQTPQEAIEITEKLIKKYQGNPYVTVSVAPHSIYAVCRENLLRAKEVARKYNTLFHLHLAETQFEFDQCLKNNGMTPVQYLDSLGILDEYCILAHCVWVTDDDIAIMAKRDVSVAHCPLSNLKLGSGIAPVAKMRQQGVNVALGTDGSASSNRLDIWEAGKFAVLLQKGINNDPACLSKGETLKMMSVDGLNALKMKMINGQTSLAIEKTLAGDEKKLDLYYLNIEQISPDNLEG